jgi:membrane dipeptidase
MVDFRVGAAGGVVIHSLRRLPVLTLAAASMSCGRVAPAEDALAVRAARLGQELLLVDTHIDVPYRLLGSPDNVAGATPKGDFDYPRARAGGLDVAFMSIYVPADYQEKGGAFVFAGQLIGMVEGLARDHPDQFVLATSVGDVRREAGRRHVVLALGMENGAALENDPKNVRHFHARGVRYITLTHSKANQIADSSYDENRPWGGLSPFGREVVAEMNRVGVMVDVSHVSDEAARQAIELSRAPVIASHSSCRHFTPGWERNLSDELIVAVAERGGVVQINFGSSFLDDAYRVARKAGSDELERYFKAQGIEEASGAGRDHSEAYWREHRLVRPGVRRVADHIDHVVRIAGVDHVGLGSDFDGVGDTLPEGLRDVSQYPNLIRELLVRGYTEEDLRKICGENLLRVWTEVERLAARSPAG